jgi:hypothetical protein
MTEFRNILFNYSTQFVIIKCYIPGAEVNYTIQFDRGLNAELSILLAMNNRKILLGGCKFQTLHNTIITSQSLNY